MIAEMSNDDNPKEWPEKFIFGKIPEPYDMMTIDKKKAVIISMGYQYQGTIGWHGTYSFDLKKWGK